MTALTFAPMIFFSLVSFILYLSKKVTFKLMVILFAITAIARLVIAFADGGVLALLAVLAQVIIGFAGFVILVMFVSNTSWETILTMTSMLAFTPLFEGVPAFIATYILFFLYGLSQLHRGEMKNILYDAVVSSGMASSLPNYEHLASKEYKKGQKRVTILPFIFIAYTLNALYFIFSPLWIES